MDTPEPINLIIKTTVMNNWIVARGETKKCIRKNATAGNPNHRENLQWNRTPQNFTQSYHN